MQKLNIIMSRAGDNIDNKDKSIINKDNKSIIEINKDNKSIINNLYPVNEDSKIVVFNENDSARNRGICTGIDKLDNLRTSNHVYHNKFRILRYSDLWIDSYSKLVSISKSKSKLKLTKGMIIEKSRKQLLELRKSVLNHSYKFGENTYITVYNNNKLVCKISKDKLVIEVLRKLLTAIYDPKFTDKSHGNRGGRSVHTALRHIKKDFGGTKWMSVGNVSNFLADKAFLKKVIEIVYKDTGESRIRDLMYKSLKSNENFEDNRLDKVYGDWYGLLRNIYLNKLDQFIEQLMLENNKGDQRPRSAEFRRCVRTKGVKTAYKLGLRPMDYMSDLFTRMVYVRYEDDIIIGFCNNIAVAKDIMSKIKEYIEIELELEYSDLYENKPIIKFKKSNINKPVIFLGYEIYMRKAVEHNGGYRDSGRGKIRFRANKRIIFRVWKERGYCLGDGTPIANTNFYDLSQSEINRIVNQNLDVLCEYYKLVEMRQQFMCHMFSILRDSIVRLYAGKYKLRSKKKVYTLGERDLSKNLKKGKPLKFRSKKDISEEKRLEGLKYSRYNLIPKGDRAPLSKDFKVTSNDVINFRKKSMRIEDKLRRIR